jgi:hypothetical protein
MSIHLAAECLYIEGFLGCHINSKYTVTRILLPQAAASPGLAHPQLSACEHPDAESGQPLGSVKHFVQWIQPFPENASGNERAYTQPESPAQSDSARAPDFLEK